MESTLKTSIKRFFLLQMALLLVITAVVSLVGIYSRVSQAKLLGSAVRNDFVIGDIRNVISAMSYALPLGFEYIKATSVSSRELFEVGDKVKSDQIFVFESVFDVRATLDSDGISLGKIYFYYSLVPLFLTSIWIWLLFLVLSLPLILLENRRIRKEYEKSLLLKEADIRHSIAEQVAHDIRSPLSVLNLISHKVSDVDEVRDLYSNALKRINGIANELLSNRKVIHNELIQHLNTATLVNKVVRDIFEEKRVLWLNNLSLTFLLDIGTREEVSVKADTAGIMRILSNILNNSFEALSNEIGEITLGTRETSTHVIFYILDNGKGMSEDTLKSLGLKGYTAGKENGHGLGVFGVKNFVQENNGTFEVKSKLGNGTLVEIHLPIHLN